MIDAVIIGNSAYDINTFLNRDGQKTKTVINKGGACLYSLIPASIYKKIGVVTRIGTDFDKELFNKINIDLSGLKVIVGETTKFMHTYLDEDGQIRTFNPVVNEECLITVKDIPEHYLKAKYIHVSTNFPNTQLEIVKYLKQHSNAIISVDTHEAYANDPKVLETFNLVDIAFIDKEFTNLYDCKAKIKIFKLGKEGCKFVSSDKEFISSAPKCDYVVDKTGAGDVVTGAFLSLKSLGYRDEDALEQAVNLATLSITNYGVEHLLKEKIELARKTIEKDEKLLRTQSIDVDFNNDKENLIYWVDMLKTYCRNNAVYALALIQLGINKKIIYIKNTSTDMDKNKLHNHDEEIIMINPTIIEKKGHTQFLEGCQSCTSKTIPNGFITGIIDRPYSIVVEYYNLKGEKVTEAFEGFKTTVFCHEYDHLNGILHIDLAKEIFNMTLEDMKKYRSKNPYKVLSIDKSCEENKKYVKKNIEV